MFNHLTSLKTLSLKGNKRKSIGNDCFMSLSNVQKLMLDNNQLAFIPNATFINLAKLDSLGLNGNMIENIEENTLIGLVKLEILDLGNNRLVNIHKRAFTHIANVNQVNMKNNRLYVLDPALFLGLTSLRLLYLDDNYLRSLADHTFNSLQELTVLRLTGNNFSSVNKETFSGLYQLKQLHLSSNQIKTIDTGSLTDLFQLKILCLDSNQLTHIYKRLLSYLKNLIRLDLSHNSLVFIEEGSFAVHPLLIFLNITNNLLTDFKNGLFTKKWSSKQVGGYHLNIIQLVAMDLHNNLLTSIPNLDWAMFPNLKRLVLSNNSIRSLETKTLLKLNKIKIDLRKNKIISTCSNQEILKSIAGISIQVDCTVNRQTYDIVKLICNEFKNKCYTIQYPKVNQVSVLKEGTIIKTLPAQLRIKFHYVFPQKDDNTCNSVSFIIAQKFTGTCDYELTLDKTENLIILKLYDSSELAFSRNGSVYSNSSRHLVQLSQMYYCFSMQFDNNVHFNIFHPQKLRGNATATSMYTLVSSTCIEGFRIENLQLEARTIHLREANKIVRHNAEETVSNSSKRSLCQVNLSGLFITLMTQYFVMLLL